MYPILLLPFAILVLIGDFVLVLNGDVLIAEWISTLVSLLLVASVVTTQLLHACPPCKGKLASCNAVSTHIEPSLIFFAHFAEKMYRPPSLSRNQGELRKHFEFSEVRDKQIETKKLNSLTFPV